MTALTAYAARSAVLIDEVFTGAMRRLAAAGGTELVQAHGGSARLGGLIDFRVPLRVGAVSATGYAAVRRYVHPDDRAAQLVAMVVGGGVSFHPDGGFQATPTGLAFLAELTAYQQSQCAIWWADQPLAAVAEVASSLLATARPTGGEALAAMAPAEMPTEPGHAVAVLNLVGTLRYHRADAHAAAWGSAGLDAPGMQALPVGPLRDEIELRTNELAALPYAAWSGTERTAWLAALTALTPPQSPHRTSPPPRENPS